MQQILVTDEKLQINFKDGSLSIELSAEELKGKLNPTATEEAEGEKPVAKKSPSKNTKKGK